MADTKVKSANTAVKKTQTSKKEKTSNIEEVKNDKVVKENITIKEDNNVSELLSYHAAACIICNKYNELCRMNMSPTSSILNDNDFQKYSNMLTVYNTLKKNIENKIEEKLLKYAKENLDKN